MNISYEEGNTFELKVYKMKSMKNVNFSSHNPILGEQV